MDPEIRDLQVATARAYAIAERLAGELERTVEELISHVEGSRVPRGGTDTPLTTAAARPEEKL